MKTKLIDGFIGSVKEFRKLLAFRKLVDKQILVKYQNKK